MRRNMFFSVVPLLIHVARSVKYRFAVGLSALMFSAAQVEQSATPASAMHKGALLRVAGVLSNGKPALASPMHVLSKGAAGGKEVHSKYRRMTSPASLHVQSTGGTQRSYREGGLMFPGAPKAWCKDQGQHNPDFFYDFPGGYVYGVVENAVQFFNGSTWIATSIMIDGAGASTSLKDAGWQNYPYHGWTFPTKTFGRRSNGNLSDVHGDYGLEFFNSGVSTDVWVERRGERPQADTLNVVS